MKKYLASLAVLFSPALALAVTQVNDISSLFSFLNDILAAVLPFLVALGFIYFVWALINFLKSAGKDKDAAKDQMIWGIVILAVIVSAWGLVGVLKSAVSQRSASDVVNTSTLLPTR